ncbi:F-box only protein 31 isoform X2 [Penaeus vannamei]|uniref:F-box only protein 31 isoform X2 n=1 Tax=Penaeus vannamei TaxID=6689 RepID=UPI00387F66A8
MLRIPSLGKLTVTENFTLLESGKFSLLCFSPMEHAKAVWKDFQYNQTEFDVIHEHELFRRIKLRNFATVNITHSHGMKLLCLSHCYDFRLIHKPLVLPHPNDIPESLLLLDGSCPKQLIAPGLFQGSGMGMFLGTQLFVLKYRNERELCAYTVTGDHCVPAEQPYFTALLEYPVGPITINKDQKFHYYEELIDLEMKRGRISDIPEQSFILPLGFQLPVSYDKCYARTYVEGCNLKHVNINTRKKMDQDKDSGGLHLTDLSEDVLVKILMECSAHDLVAISSTCKLFYRLARDEIIWKYHYKRDYNISQANIGDNDSYYKLYANLLHKYGWLQGTYQTEVGPFGELMEVKFENGCIKGLNWEPGSERDVDAPLKHYVMFSIKGDKKSDCVCLPDIAPHSCSFVLDKRRGQFKQQCSEPDNHIQALVEYIISGIPTESGRVNRLKMVFLNEVLGSGALHQPILIPGPHDIPQELLMKDGTLPPQLITPGLFKGSYGSHGTEFILFKYKDENELHGIKVTGDPNVYAGKISVKVSLRFPVKPLSKVEQRSYAILKDIEPEQSAEPISSIKPQAFIPPDGFDLRDTSPPDNCKARYHGFGQIAFEGFQHPNFIGAHIMVFNNDLLGVAWITLESFSLFRRVKNTFTQNILTDVESAL